jgi:transposase
MAARKQQAETVEGTLLLSFARLVATMQNLHLSRRNAQLLEEKERLAAANVEMAVRLRELRLEVAALREENRGLRRQLARLQHRFERLSASFREFRHQLHGRHSERGPVAGSQAGEPAVTAESMPDDMPELPPGHVSGATAERKRGARPGHVGHGRRVDGGLPCVEQVVTLPEEQRRCAHCGAIYEPMSGAFAVSHVLDCTALWFYRRFLRQKYRRSCSCVGPERILIAPPPAKVIARGLLSPRAIAHVCLEKFWWGRPLQRQLTALEVAVGRLPVTAGGLTGTLRRLVPLLEPLYEAICAHVRQQSLAAADETTATVFEPDKPQKGQHPRWWTWIFKTGDAAAFRLAPRRDAHVAFHFFAWDPNKPPARPHLILLSDCFSAYKSLAGWVVQAFCWAHIRRKFVKLARTTPSVEERRWAEGWRQRIATLYERERARHEAMPGTEPWQAADRALRAFVQRLRHQLRDELRQGGLGAGPAGVLRSLEHHWAGLTVFLDHPEVPLDNNEVERILRVPVVGRKNFYFFGCRWSAHLAEMLWSILATALLAGLNPLTYLTAFLQASAQQGQPLSGAALARFLPWALQPQDRTAWRQPLPPDAQPLARTPDGQAATAGIEAEPRLGVQPWPTSSEDPPDQCPHSPALCAAMAGCDTS